MPISHRTIAVNGIDLAVDEAGVGGRPLLLIHGFTGDRTDFTMVLDELADAGWHVVVPDNRGHGTSSHPPSEDDYTFATYATDVLALADAVGFERFTLLGHSMGGMIVQHVALRSPERLDGLVLMDTSHGPLGAANADIVELVADLARTQGIDAVADAMQKFDLLDSQAFLRAVEADPSYGVRGDRLRRQSSPMMFAASITEIAGQADRLAELATLDVPTLVIVGEEDEPFLADSHHLAETIPGARLAIIAGGGHSPQFEAPAAWREALFGFLAELPVAPR